MTHVISIAVWQIVQFAALVILGFGLWMLYCRLDDRIEKRRENAYDVAVAFEKRGFKRIPRILRAYATGNYSGVWDEIKSFSKAIVDGPEAMTKELDTVFALSLSDKLATQDGVTLVKAAVAEAEAKLANTRLGG